MPTERSLDPVNLGRPQSWHCLCCRGPSMRGHKDSRRWAKHAGRAELTFSNNYLKFGIDGAYLSFNPIVYVWWYKHMTFPSHRLVSILHTGRWGILGRHVAEPGQSETSNEMKGIRESNIQIDIEVPSIFK